MVLLLAFSTSFNPRSHEGSDFSAWSMVRAIPCFNPRSHEGSDNSVSSTDLFLRGFNPRSHEGSDVPSFPAPRPIRQFQSTLPRRERLITDYYMGGEKACFNPRSHEGSDRRCPPAAPPGSAVSIHAPTKGATSLPCSISYYFLVSIHAPTKGATCNPAA